MIRHRISHLQELPWDADSATALRGVHRPSSSGATDPMLPPRAIRMFQVDALNARARLCLEASADAAMEPARKTELLKVIDGERVEAVRRLLLEYGESLRYQICFNRFQEELEGLPGAYGPPRGGLWLACVDGVASGCVGLRITGDPAIGEIKRLYVRPTSRGMGLGRRLARTAIEAGRSIGYRVLRLDTLPSMNAARALYRSLGFESLAAGSPAGGKEPIDMELGLGSSPVDGRDRGIPGL